MRKAVKILYEADDAVTMCSHSDHAGLTPLHHAAFTGNPHIVDILTSNSADPAPRSHQSDTILDAEFHGWVQSYRSLSGDFVKIIET